MWLRVSLVVARQAIRVGAAIYESLVMLLPTVFLVVDWWQRRQRRKREGE